MLRQKTRLASHLAAIHSATLTFSNVTVFDLILGTILDVCLLKQPDAQYLQRNAFVKAQCKEAAGV